MKTTVKLAHEKVRFDRDNDTHLVISLQAPTINIKDKRPRVCIIPVVDISGSMAGDKLTYAKKSVIKLIEHLQPEDMCGIVVFDGIVETLSPPLKMTSENKETLKAKVNTLAPRGSTNFSGGLLEALNIAKNLDLSSDTLVRAILFTDGQANTGVATRKSELIPLLEEHLGRATVSFFGYGTDADQELLADLAQKGKGNYAFIRNPEDAISAFAKELGGLLSIYAQNITLDLTPHNSHEIVEVVSDLAVEDKEDRVRIKLFDILSEERRDVVVALKLLRQKQALPRQMSVLDVQVNYDLVNAKGEKQSVQESFKAKARFVKDGEEQKYANPELDRIIGLAQAAKAQKEAEEKAKRGDFAGATQVLKRWVYIFEERKLPDLVLYCNNISTKMENQNTFIVNAGYLRSTYGGITRSMGISSYDTVALNDIQSLGCPVTNSVQSNTVSSFTGTIPPLEDLKIEVKVTAPKKSKRKVK